MALVDLCKVQVLSTGTGPLALGSAVPGFDGLAALTDGTDYSYAIQQDSNWEYGLGTYVASGPTLLRAPIKSSFGLATAIALSGGAQVTFTALAEDFAALAIGVVNSLTGGSTTQAPSVAVVNTALGAKAALVNNTYSGNQTISKTTASDSRYVLNAIAGQVRAVTYQVAGVTIFEAGVDGTGNYFINRFVSGAYQDTPIEIDASTGLVNYFIRPKFGAFTPWDSGNFTPSAPNIAYNSGDTGATTRTVFATVRELGIRLSDFNAIGDGSPSNAAANTVAINEWLTALQAAPTAQRVGIMPPGNYVYAPGINALGAVDSLSFHGAGSGNSIFTYQGTAAAGDDFHFGGAAGSGTIDNFQMRGIRFCSNVNRTSGVAVHFQSIARSYFDDVVCNGQDVANFASGLHYDGFWFDGCDKTHVAQHEITGCLRDGVIVNGNASGGYPQADFFLGLGTIGGNTRYGLHVAGNMGGTTNFGSDILFNGVNTAITCQKVALGNQQTFLWCQDDSSQVGPNILVDETGGVGSGGGVVHFRGWSASAKTHGIHLKYAPNYTVNLAGGMIISNLGDGIRVDDASAKVFIDGIAFNNNAGYDINPNVANHQVCIGFNGPLGSEVTINKTFSSTADIRAYSPFAQIDDLYAGSLGFRPTAGAAPANIGDACFELISNTQVLFRLKGTDGTVRSATLTLT